jgi:hypothetical protein
MLLTVMVAIQKNTKDRNRFEFDGEFSCTGFIQHYVPSLSTVIECTTASKDRTFKYSSKDNLVDEG